MMPAFASWEDGEDPRRRVCHCVWVTGRMQLLQGLRRGSLPDPKPWARKPRPRCLVRGHPKSWEPPPSFSTRAFSVTLAPWFAASLHSRGSALPCLALQGEEVV